MADRTLLVHGSLALSMGVLALWAWRAPESKADDGVVLLQTRPDDVTSVSFSDASYDVTLERQGERFVVHVVDCKGKKPEDPPPAAKTYPGTPRIKDFLERLAPLKAVRQLGTADLEKEASFGLDKPPMRLVVSRGEQKQELAIGNATYGGGTHYARLEKGELYLVKAALFSDLKNGATSLTERNVLAVQKEKAARIVLSGSGKRRELLQRHADQKGKSFWADPAEPDTKLQQASSFVDRLVRLRLVDFTQTAPTKEPALVVEVFGDDGTLGKLEIWPSEGDVGVVRSTAFAMPLTVNKSTLDGLLKDVDGVLGERS